MDVLDLARELVSIDSVTGKEGRIGAVIADRMERAGWQVVRQAFSGGEPSIKEPRANILARDDGDAPPRLVFTTHLDTVPPFLPLREDTTHLWGRGTCDAKGILAAQWVAVERLRSRGYRGLALLGVVGEETDSVGARAAGQILPKAQWIIDGEPTGLIMTSAAKGILSLRARAEGVAGHSAYPERGRSATHALIAGLQRLLAEPLPADPAIGATTVNVGQIEGGLAPNVIAPTAEARVMIRLAAPVAQIRTAVAAALGAEIETEELSASDPLQIHVPEGYRSAPVSFGSDVPYLKSLGTALLVGPGSIHDAHTATERISKEELLESVEFYVQLGERLLGPPPGR